MTIYIRDTTVSPRVEQHCNSFQEAVTYLEGMSKRAYKQTRAQRMNMLTEIGHGYDDRDSINFVRSMADAFEMGIIRNNAGAMTRLKCDITSISQYQKAEYGD